MEASPPTWIGLLLAAAAVTALGASLRRLSHRPDWSPRHVAAAGLGLMLGRGLLAYAEALAPHDVRTYWLNTGADQSRLLRMYKKAGYRTCGPGEGPGTVDLTKRRAGGQTSR